MLVLLFLVAISVAAATVDLTEWIQMEAERSHAIDHPLMEDSDILYRKGLTWERKADAELEHLLVFQVKNGNSAELEKLLLEIGNPESSRFGEQITPEALFALTKNAEGEEIIANFLRNGGARITTQSPGLISAAAPVRLWNSLLQADFHMVHTGKAHLSVPRTRTYHLPRKVAAHVDMVRNTVQIPILQDENEPPVFTAIYTNATSLETEEFSATVTRKVTPAERENMEL
jgi:hypothetical protein